MGPIKFVAENKAIPSTGEKPADNSSAGLETITFEAAASALEEFTREAEPATEDRTTRVRGGDAGAQAESDTITFPQFEPVPEDIDEGVALPPIPIRAPAALTKPKPTPAPAAFPKPKPIPAPTAPPKSTHQRRSRLWPGLLLALVVLQAVPAFLWLRDRLGVSTLTMGMLDGVKTTATPPPAAPSTSAAAAPKANGGSSPRAVGSSPRAVGSSSRAVGSSSRAVGSSSRAVGTASVVPRPAKPASSSGMVSVAAPGRMQVYSKGRMIGATGAPIKLPPGSHDLEFVSEDLGYRETQRVTVQASRTTRVRLDPPKGLLNINATPWAEVWIDNQRIGETPIGNFRVAIGQREVMFRHPELGERRASVVVTLKEPGRVAMDMRQK